MLSQRVCVTGDSPSRFLEISNISSDCNKIHELSLNFLPKGSIKQISFNAWDVCTIVFANESCAIQFAIHVQAIYVFFKIFFI